MLYGIDNYRFIHEDSIVLILILLENALRLRN